MSLYQWMEWKQLYHTYVYYCVLYISHMFPMCYVSNVYSIAYVAVCPAGCYNGGNCSMPGICTCLSGWTGNECRQGTYL